MMKKPLLLDLFCGAGGCAMGYHRAGFDVVGVDANPQRNYPFAFVQMDAITAMEHVNQNHWYIECATDDLVWFGKDFAAIHASPPCQRFSTMTKRWKDSEHPDLISITRNFLIESGLPYVIENVPGSPLNNPVILCGSMFGLNVRRHRCFEVNFPVRSMRCQHEKQGKVIGVYGHAGGSSNRDGIAFSGTGDWRLAMGIDWMTGKQLAQAIPPAYTEFIGKQLMAKLA